MNASPLNGRLPLQKYEQMKQEMGWKLAFGMMAVSIIVMVGCEAFGQSPPPIWKFKVVATFPHDSQAYTQGLVFEGGFLYEGTGHYGKSSLRQVELESGRVLKSLPLDAQYFGEGITILRGKIYQLTWKEKICFVTDLKSFQCNEFFRYRNEEGWGLTHNGRDLILSDGTSTIRFIDPATFKERRAISVREGTRRINKLNELEYIDNEIWANIWYEDRIVRISPETGRVLGSIDLSELYPVRERANVDHVLNGIAQDPATKKIYVTGKNWPKVYEIEIMK